MSRGAKNITALMVAANFNQLNAVQLLSDHEMGFYDSDGHTALYYACL